MAAAAAGGAERKHHCPGFQREIPRAHRELTEWILAHPDEAVLFGVMLVIILIGLAVHKTLSGPVEQFLHCRWGTARLVKQRPSENL